MSKIRAVAVGVTVSLVVASVATTHAAGSSELSLKVGKTNKRVYAFGTMVPPRPGAKVRVRLMRDTGDGFVRVARKAVELSRRKDADGDGTYESHYRAVFQRPQTGTCKAVAVYPGDRRTARSVSRQRFPCGIPDFASGIATMRSSSGMTQIDVGIAQSSEQRAYGLMYRMWLGSDKGMAFRFESDTDGGFWMKNTLIPLSIAFYDGAGTIVRILDMEPCEADPCPTYSPGARYREALEVNQGSFDRWGISEGDTIVVTET